MYTWLIIIAAVILYFYWKKGEGQTQSINVQPKLEKIETALKLHEEKINKIKNDANEVRREREAFDESLNFSKQLWTFIEAIRLYPHWYENSKKRSEAAYWRSKTIHPEELSVKKYSKSDLKKNSASSKFYDLNDDDEILEYSFNVGNNSYALYVNTNHKAYEYEVDSEHVYYPIFIFENNIKLVYRANLSFEKGEYDNFYYGTYLQAFKPGEWVKFLIEKFSDISAEENKYSREFNDKMANERKKDNEENFL